MNFDPEMTPLSSRIGRFEALSWGSGELVDFFPSPCLEAELMVTLPV